MRAVNLIPADQRGGGGISAGRAGGTVYAVFGLLAGLAIMALIYGVSAHQISSRKSQVATITAQAQQAQAKAAALAPYTSFVAMREQRVQAVDALVNSRFNWAQAFHEFGRVLPSNVSLTSLDGTVGSASGSSLQLQLQRRGGFVGELGHPARERAHVHARRLHDQPGGGRIDDRPAAFDERGQRSDAVELHQIRLNRQLQLQWRRRLRGHLQHADRVRRAADDPHVRLDRLGEDRLRLDERRHAHPLHGSGPMTGRDRIVVVALATLAVLAAVWLLAVAPEREKAAKLATEVSTAQAQLTSAESQVHSAAAAQAQYQTDYASIVSLGKAVPADQEVPSLIYQLAQATNEKNVEFTSITSGGSGGSSPSSPASKASAATGASSRERVRHGCECRLLTDAVHLPVQRQLQQPQRPLPAARRLRPAHDRRRCARQRAPDHGPERLALARGSSGSASGGSGKSNELSASITATAYVLPAGQSLTGGATPAGPAGTPTQTASTGASSSANAPAVVQVNP